MDLNTSYQDKLIDIDNELKTFSRYKQFSKKEKPFSNLDEISSDKFDGDSRGSNNPFLDKSVRSLLDEFVLTWHKIFLELLDIPKYDTIRRDEWWNFLQDLFMFLKNIFWINDRLFHIGMGFVIISFFVFFIFVTQ